MNVIISSNHLVVVFTRYQLHYWCLGLLIGACQPRTEPANGPLATDIPFDSIETCEEGLQKAKYDLEQQHCTVMVGADLKSSSFDSILMEEYNLKVQYSGCLINEGWECYRSYMDSIINSKFGESIFIKTRAKSLLIDYEKITGIDPSSIRVVDLNDQSQETFLGPLLELNPNESIKTGNICSVIRSVTDTHGLPASVFPVTIEFDTLGHVYDMTFNSLVNFQIIRQIKDSLSMLTSAGTIEIYGEKKHFKIRLCH